MQQTFSETSPWSARATESIAANMIILILFFFSLLKVLNLHRPGGLYTTRTRARAGLLQFPDYGPGQFGCLLLFFLLYFFIFIFLFNFFFPFSFLYSFLVFPFWFISLLFYNFVHEFNF
jgi:hypothetical protein